MKSLTIIFLEFEWGSHDNCWLHYLSMSSTLHKSQYHERKPIRNCLLCPQARNGKWLTVQTETSRSASQICAWLKQNSVCWVMVQNTKALWIILLLVLGSFLVGQDQFVQSLTDLCFQVKHIIKKEEKNRAWLWFYLLVVDWKEADLNESL